MNKKKASKILQQQIDKVDNLNESNESLWLIETQTYIDSFFGDNSYHHSHIKNFRFTNRNAEPLGQKSKGKVGLKFEIKQFLKDCINTITNIGIKKEPVDNWFSKLPNWVINLGLPAICFISFGVGILFTNNTNSELRKENTELKEQLFLIPSDTISNQHKNLGNKPK